MRLFILLFIGGIAAYGIWLVISRYNAAEGTTWERLLATAKGSASILWQYVVAFGGLAITWASSAADVFNMPEVQAFIKEHLRPDYVGPALVAIAVIGIVARLRTLRAD